MPDLEQPSREALLGGLDSRREPFDVVVVGGGASGLGVAVDAAARGFSTALFEAEDFAKGTSSRATKLVHGGVRYLARGDVALVREALRERRLLLDNAPHLVQPLGFVLPAYGWRGRLWDRWFYGAGLVAYDALAGRAGLGRTRLLDAAATAELAPGLREAGLCGGICYLDAQFDDARLAVALARTALRLGGCVLNHCRVTALVPTDGLHEVEIEDRETGIRRQVRARCVVNAAGVWVDGVRRLEEPQAGDMVAPSQGAHLVVDREFFPSSRALLVPRTPDGRVLFAVPWLGHVILGTTDTPRHDALLEPRPLEAEIDYILAEAGRYLARPPSRGDVRSAWAGLRPLVKPARGAGVNTQRLSREHTVVVSAEGLVTVAGGKWTTYRAMAEDVLAACFSAGLLPARPAGATRTLRLVGAPPAGAAALPLSAAPGLHLYGSEAVVVRSLAGADRELLPGLTEAMVRFAVRVEYARTVEDVLARRSRWLFLDAARAAAAAGPVAAIMAEELGPSFAANASAAAFVSLARGYGLAE
jgi:glycerol-3-phosphate dehydrogenase